jgi:sugar lactone lactonase YvrE
MLQMKRKLVAFVAGSCLWATGLAQVITQQPGNQTVAPGGNVTFTVTASGAGPFRYQWQFNGTNIPNIALIFTVAGNGTPGYSGDGGPATNASLGMPSYVAVDGAGNLFISDSGNNRIRKVPTNGVIQTFAGVGPTFGNGSYGGDGGPATNANLWSPSGLALDSAGSVFFSEVNNQRVRKVDTNGIITTAVMSDGPVSVAVDSSNNLFVADVDHGCIYEVTPNGTMTMAVGNGTIGYAGDGASATNAEFNFNYGAGLAFDAAGNLFIGDSFNERVRRLGTDGVVTTVAGTGTWGFTGNDVPATTSELTLPQGVAVDAFGNLFIADWGNNRIRQVDTNGIITTVAGDGPNLTFGSYSGDGGPATNASLNNPSGVAVDAAGNLFIADTYNQRIREIALGGLPTLALSNLAATNAGQYRVIITSSSGSITSSVANLTLIWPVLISSIVHNVDGSVALNCLSAPNSTNVLFVSTALVSPAAWQIVSTNIAAADGTWQYTDTNTAGLSARFYRFLTR